MNELIQKLVQEASLSQEQAEKAVPVMKAYIKAQLPPMMQGIVDNFMQEKGAGGENADFMG